MATTLARKFRIDVTSDQTLATGWLQLNGIDDWNADTAPTVEDTSAYDTTGWTSSEITMQAWTATASVFRRQVSNVYDPGQELCRVAGMGQFGTAARLGVRWYDKNGGAEAYSGIALVDWTRNNTGVSNVEKATIVFTGTDIALNMGITNPGTAATAPLLLSALPSGRGAGQIVTITGSAFTGTVSMTIGGVATPNFVVNGDNQIVAVVPTGTAGSAPIIVTNGVGPSTALPYTRAT
jgi:hypothetical protein